MNNNTTADFTHPMILEYLRVETERYREIQREQEERMSWVNVIRPRSATDLGLTRNRRTQWNSMVELAASLESRGVPPFEIRRMVADYAEVAEPTLVELAMLEFAPRAEERMNTNVQDPLERRSREALNENMERLAVARAYAEADTALTEDIIRRAFEAAAADRQGKTQQEETKMDIPKEIVLLIEKHPASTVTLALLRQATKTPVPQECVGDAPMIREWLAGCDDVTWPGEASASMFGGAVPANPAREFEANGLNTYGGYINVDFHGSCHAFATAFVNSSAYTQGTCSIDIDDLPEEVDSVEELADLIRNEITTPDMEEDLDSVEFDVCRDCINWDSIGFEDFEDEERECSHEDILNLARWLINEGRITLIEEDDEEDY